MTSTCHGYMCIYIYTIILVSKHRGISTPTLVPCCMDLLHLAQLQTSPQRTLSSVYFCIKESKKKDETRKREQEEESRGRLDFVSCQQLGSIHVWECPLYIDNVSRIGGEIISPFFLLYPLSPVESEEMLILLLLLVGYRRRNERQGEGSVKLWGSSAIAMCVSPREEICRSANSLSLFVSFFFHCMNQTRSLTLLTHCTHVVWEFRVRSLGRSYQWL